MIKCENGDCWIEGQGTIVFAEMVSILRSFTHMLRENYEGDDPEDFIKKTMGYINYLAFEEVEITHGESREEHPRA